MDQARILVGIDAGPDGLAICAIDQIGALLGEWQTTASLTHISEQLAGLGSPNDILVGIEAGETAIHLTRGLRAAAYQVRVLETRHASAFMKVRQNKTDRNDARGIAEIVRLGLSVVPAVMVKSSKIQLLRSELVLRDRLMKQRTATENGIKAVLRLNGGRLTRSWSGTHLDRCVKNEIARLKHEHIDLTEVVLPVLEIAVALRKTLERATRRLERVAQTDPTCRRLMSMPGVGTICALSFYTAVEDPARFVDNADVGPYFGLVPRVSQSGGSAQYGRITHRGNTMTRTHLVTAAKSLMQQPRQDCQLRRWAIKLAERAGRRKAQVALARKMAITLLAMWKSEESFIAEPTSRSELERDAPNQA